MSPRAVFGGRIRAGTSIISTLVFLTFVFLLGRAIAHNPGLTVGSWVINLAPAGILGSVLLAYLTLSPAGAHVNLGSAERLSVVQFVILGGGSLLVGAGLFLLLLSSGSLILVLVGSLAGVLFGTGLWWLASGSRLRGLEAFLLSLPFVHFLEYELRVTSVFQPTSALLWAFTGVLILRMSVDGSHMVRSPLSKYILIVLATSALASSLSVDPSTSFWTTGYVASMSAMFWVVLQCVRSREEMIEFLTVVVVAGLLRVVSIGYFVYLKSGGGISDISAYYGLSRWRPEWIVGWWLLILVPICFAGVIAFKESWKKLVSAGCTVASLVLCLPMAGRSGVGALAGGLALFGLLRRGRPYLLGLLALGAVGTLVLWPLITQTRLMRFQEFDSLAGVLASQHVRIDAGGAAIAMMLDHPFTGIGPGLWDEYVADYTSVYFMAPQERIYVSSAHNVLLHQGANSGVPGLLALASLAGAMIWRAVGLVRAERGSNYQPFAVAVLAVVASYWVFAVTGGDALYIQSFSDAGYCFWMLVGIVAAWDRLLIERWEPTPGDASFPISRGE